MLQAVRLVQGKFKHPDVHLLKYQHLFLSETSLIDFAACFYDAGGILSNVPAAIISDVNERTHKSIFPSEPLAGFKVPLFYL